MSEYETVILFSKLVMFAGLIGVLLGFFLAMRNR